MLNQRNAALAATFALMVGTSGCKKSADELEQQAAALAAEPLTAESTERAIAEAKANAEEQLKNAEAEARKVEAEAKRTLEEAAEGAGGEKAANAPSDKLAGDPSGVGEKKGLVPTPPKTVSPTPPKTAPVEEKKGLLPSPPKTEPPKADPPTAEPPKADPPAETAPTPRRRSFQERKGVSKKRLPTGE